MSFASVLFDLDGTLTDPAAGITRSIQAALHTLGIEEPDPKRLYSFIGPPLEETFRVGYALSPKQVEKAIACYRAYYQQTGIWEHQVIPGVATMLAALRKAGKTLLVASSKPEIFVRQILEHDQLAPFFTFAGGSELDGRRAQKEEVVRYVLQQSGVSRLSAVMVGDRKYDIWGARKNAIASIGVLYGYGDQAELLEAGADALAGTVEQLTGLLLP